MPLQRNQRHNLSMSFLTFNFSTKNFNFLTFYLIFIKYLCDCFWRLHFLKAYQQLFGWALLYNIERCVYLDFSLIYESSVYFSPHAWHYACLHLIPSLPPTPISRCKHPDRNLCNVVLTFTHSFLLANLASFNYHKLSIIQS